MNRWLTSVILFAGCVALAPLSEIASAQPPGQGKLKAKFGKLAPKAKDAPAANSGFNDKPSAEQVAFFEKKIRPVLIDHCYKCHAADSEKIKGGLTLDTRDGVRKGGDGGAVIVPGSPDRSSLIKAIRYKDPNTQMPPKAKLSDEQIADLETWVKMGAPDPRDQANGGRKPTGGAIDIEKGRQFWAFQPPKDTPPPRSRDAKRSAWATTPIDAFLMAELEKSNLTPVGDADKRTLLRRVYLDLTGLPPTPEEVDAFLHDSAIRNPQSAFETVVDKLLASPQFGERWGRHWLDIARYAESSGKTANFNYPHAWRYRDYVIDAFNKDKPYDQFIKEQLAGDLMPSTDSKMKAERIIATGFLAIGPKTLNERNGLQFELDVVDEQIDVTTQAFLGITAACARCHDHKFDPITQRDYYALAGIFRSTETCYGTVRFIQSQRPSPLIDLPRESVPSAISAKLTDKEREGLEKQIKDIQERMRNVTDPINNIFNAGQLALTRSKLDSYHADGTPKLQAMGVREKPSGGGFGGFGGPKGGGPGMMMFGPGRGGQPTVGDSPIYTRGEPDKPTAERVPRGAISVVSKTQPKIRSGSGRLELANWIASKDNPLTARVMANRVWLHLFGRGLVPSADNFGIAGQPPTHPELLDHLAVTFAADWSVKKLIRRVVLSHAYQLDSKYDAKNHDADPENALVWRMTPRRLDAESLRDSMLAVSGRLDTVPPVGSIVARAGEGPPNARFRQGENIQGAINDPSEKHRSVYLPVVRDNMVESLALFDAADPSLIVADRQTTTVPSQGLFLMNNPFVIRSSEAAADKLLKGTTTDSERIHAAYLMFYGRPPSEKELTAASDFVKSYSGQLKKERVVPARQQRETWAAFCQALFGSAEFQYRK